MIEDSHPPKSEDQLRLMSRLRHQVLEDATPVQHIYQNEISAMTPSEDANLASVKSPEKLPPEKRFVFQPTDTTMCEPGRNLTERTDEWRFKCVEDGVEENIIDFATDEMLENMHKVKTLLMDETFYVYPSLWC